MLPPGNGRKKHHEDADCGQLPEKPRFITRPDSAARPPHEDCEKNEQNRVRDPARKTGREIKKIERRRINVAIEISVRLPNEIAHQDWTQRHVLVPEVL